ncbi:hypothetical protein DPMN_058720 [Dreissena polymorpha]|uniref:Uncharacterized protein n=1 Tax=Dreissena polymorpha TaxID=45954 RepID=A0A9D4C2K2_DREPO|nr:hypothetical protein DPMN_058720 [Dreissena polymorpha]
MLLSMHILTRLYGYAGWTGAALAAYCSKNCLVNTGPDGTDLEKRCSDQGGLMKRMEVSQNGGNQYSQLLGKPFWGSGRRLVMSRSTIKGAQRDRRNKNFEHCQHSITLSFSGEQDMEWL